VTAARRKLLDAILADPDDDELRSVYADALAEAGDIEHADLVHAQLAIARGAGEELVALAKELETKHGRRIAGTIADHASAWSFDRGLIASIEIDLLTLADHATVILADAPIRKIRLLQVEPEDPERALVATMSLATCRHLARVQVIDALPGAFGGAHTLLPFLSSLYLTGLRELALDTDGGEEAARAIAAAHACLPALRALRFHSWHGNPLDVGDDGAIALADSPVGAQLEVLELWGAGIEARGASALARALRTVKHLSLNPVWYAANAIGVEGARGLAAGVFTQLETLHLAGTEIEDEGLLAIASAPWFAHVRELDVSDDEITDRGLAAFVDSSHARGLERLRLASGTHGGGAGNDLTIDGVRALAALPALREVALGKADETEQWLRVPFDEDELAEAFDD